jgi:hypothetical protein
MVKVTGNIIDGFADTGVTRRVDTGVTRRVDTGASAGTGSGAVSIDNAGENAGIVVGVIA